MSNLGEGGPRQVTIIEPPSGWRTLAWRELWDYRELIWVLSTRDLKVRYKQTVLGASWAILRPVLTMIVFTIIFGKFARMPSDGYPYPIFVYAGLLPWTFFSSALGGAAQSVVGSQALLTKVYFPRLIIPLSSIGSSLADFFVSGLVLLVLMGWYDVGVSFHLLAVIPLVLVSVFIAMGFGTLLAALTVTYRDFTHITPFLLQLWMYLTPVVFPVSAVPPGWRWLLYLNPMTGVVDGFRSAFLVKPFDVPALTFSLLISLVVFVFGIAYFEKTERSFADII